MDKPVTPRGIDHLVLNVRDMEESRRFWTEIVLELTPVSQFGLIEPARYRTVQAPAFGTAATIGKHSCSRVF
jgi:catechol 2,3-dioxygenase-like lactoylglutathione lyase family enzyme